MQKIKFYGKTPKHGTILKQRGRAVGAIVKIGRFHYIALLPKREK
jgi:hypothetical protein